MCIIVCALGVSSEFIRWNCLGISFELNRVELISRTATGLCGKRKTGWFSWVVKIVV